MSNSYISFERDERRRGYSIEGLICEADMLSGGRYLVIKRLARELAEFMGEAQDVDLGEFEGSTVEVPTKPGEDEIMALLRRRCDDAATIGFLTGILEGIKYRVSNELRQMIDASLERARTHYSAGEIDGQN